MSLPYGAVSDLYKTLGGHDLGFSTLPEFAKGLNEVTGTQDYDSGLQDNFVKQASHGLDKALRPVGKVAGSVMGTVAGMFGQEEIGRQVGEGLPRMAVNMAPLMIPYAGIPIAAALAGSQTYTDTGSVGAGLVSAGTMAVLPGAGKFGAQMGLKAFGAPLAEGAVKKGLEFGGHKAGDLVREYMAQTVGQKVAGYAGGQIAGNALFEASGQAQSIAQGQGWYYPLTKEHIA